MSSPIASFLRRQALAEVADQFQRLHREEVERLDLGWWAAMFSLGDRFIGGVFVHAFGPVDAAHEVRLRNLVDAKPYAVAFARLDREPPPQVRFKLLTLDELKALDP